MLDNKKNKILCVIDGSYWIYYTTFGAVSDFQRRYPKEADVWIKPAEEVDQKNLPNILNCDTFKKILKRYVMRRLETIDWHLKNYFQNEIDIADGIDYLFVLDDFVKNSFRKTLYPEYKAQRSIKKKSYDIFKIYQYIIDVIFKDVDGIDNYKLIKVDGAEGDDVIATAFNALKNDYMLNVLFASDRDFVQIEGIHQINLMGKKVECKLANKTLTPGEYLLGKIILGDGADNIKKVFLRVGEKKALALIRDKELLKSKLLADQNAAKRFKLNEQLISFKNIPEDLQQKISQKVCEVLYENEVINSKAAFNDFMLM